MLDADEAVVFDGGNDDGQLLLDVVGLNTLVCEC